MRYISRIIIASVIVSIVCIMELAAPAVAQQYTTIRPDGRGGSWEFFLPLAYTDTTTINGQGGSSVRLNNDWSFGFGFGYNFTDNLQMNGMLSWSYRSYDATAIDANTGKAKQYSNYMDSTTISMNGVYYFLNGKVSPFVAAGIGYTFMDSNIPSGTGSSSCYWDPWYGYICSSYYPTKTQEDWSYSAGLGVRFDVNRSFSTQIGYYKMWIDVKQATPTPDFDIVRMDFIFRM